ncbi:Flavodoxin domain-containing protein [Neocallimastix lanati (nom. inval.)]|uniref:Flavodoxin-like domain-containing protein n=1 Tax=Neocallimastix californiae TaxID=1754190 RepID=A0A1Y2EPX5_9FUNG|nr:Flavodoxin domain-containing protein [Neocallimastix sp. JGI-2020a]ORY73578.1 hypothetical protein LY90DRAFT_666658 [Neocallimastix californiae]|eukprot:ORY73578.1 hypothetical protein LY90DRAFT_666658 [Neocallimastix californiae]
MKIGIFYVSSNGKTKQIVNYIKKGIIKKYDLKVYSIFIKENVKYDLSKYQLIIIGGPVYYGSYSENLTSFIESNVEYLNNAYTAFFSVSCYSVSISSPFDYDPLIKNYLKLTLSDEFKPRITASFGGDLSYTKYSPSLKWVAKKSASQIKQCVKNEDITDTSKNHSLTK